MEIQPGRQGTLVVNLPGPAEYCSFRPAPLDAVLPLELDEETGLLLSKCSRKLGELVGMSRFVPNVEMFLTMYVRKEALMSAQIEGTQCTLDDVLDPASAHVIHGDVTEVVSCVDAIDYAVERMRDLPLCTRLLRETHKRLLKGTRGEEKTPGEVRTSQNWIGPRGGVLKDAPYVPPNVQDMQVALGDLDTFINNKQELDPIVKAALVHYQFETIHPFLDGNGRLGRLLITLSLINDGVLNGAVFYPSYQLKARRDEYYAWFMRVRRTGDFEGWVSFFSRCLLKSAEDAIASMEELVEVHRACQEAIQAQMGRGVSNGLRLLELIEEHPIIDSTLIVDRLGVSRTTAASLVRQFSELGILHPREDGRKRYRVYLFDRYLDVLRRGGDPL